MEMRSEDLEWVTELRLARDSAVQLSAAGQLAQVFSVDLDHAFQQVYVVKLLDVHPRLGKVAGRKWLNDNVLSHFTRVQDMSESERQELLVVCGEA